MQLLTLTTAWGTALRLRAYGRQAAGLAALGVVVAFASPDPNLERAAELYQRTAYPESLRLLEASTEKTPPTYELMGKCFYRLEEFSKATDVLEKAVAADPRNASYWDWLGKAYGRRAETSSFITAPRYAVKAREHFERALMLDPQNQEALSDLFDYYLEAPGFLGGGMDKAANLSERIRDRDPAKYHAMKARLAEKRKEFQQAEQFWRQAVQLAPAQAGRLVDLAKFLARQRRFSESDEMFERAAKIAPDNAELKFERAKTYVESKRNVDLARRLLEEYLKSTLTPDDPPRTEAESLLKSIPRTG